MRRGIGRLRAGGSGFSPISVFAGSAAGLWLDPADISTGFTDSAGTTQQTASGQQTGLRLDKRLGLGRGSELTTNGSFTGSLTPWTGVGAAFNYGSNNAVAVGGATNELYQLLGVAGSYYELSVDIVSITTGALAFYAGGNVSANLTTPGTKTARILCGSANTAIGIRTISSDAVIDNLSVKLIAGNHVAQATASTRPEYDVISGISSDFFDGSDDGYSTATFAGGTLVNGMDLFCAIKRSSTSNMVLASNGVANASFIGKMIAADGTSSMASVGAAWSVFVDGVQVGSTNSVTCGQLNTALGSGSYHVLEVRDLDLSAWTQFTLGSYTSFILGADTGGEILAPAQSTANRAALRKWLGAKVGLSL